MLNRTLVDGSKIDNRLAAHMRADVLQTEQSFIEKWQHRQMEGAVNAAAGGLFGWSDLARGFNHLHTTYEFEFRWRYYQERENGSKSTSTSYSFLCSDASF